MKQLLFIIFTFLLVINTLAKERLEEAITWDIISERLFNGDNKNAFRFEEDIEFRITGATPQDSAILKEIIAELNDLIETVEVRLTDSYGNFSISLLTLNHQINQKPMMFSFRGEIKTVKLEIVTENLKSIEERKKYFYYFIFRNLTKIFEPDYGRTDYNGVFEANTFPQFNRLSDLDKDIIRKLYSKKFYHNLKKNVVSNSGYLYYFMLRWKNWLKIVTTSISIILLFSGFLYLLSKQRNTQVTTFWEYQKKSWLIILWLAFSVTIWLIPDFTPAIKFNFKLWFFILGNYLSLFLYVILAPPMLYFLEFKYLNKFDNFLKKQIFIFISTFVTIFLSYIITSAPFVYMNAKDQMRDRCLFRNIKSFRNIFHCRHLCNTGIL